MRKNIKRFFRRLVCFFCPYQFADRDYCKFRRFVFNVEK